MELFSKKIKDKALTAASKLKANIKGRYYNLADIPAASVQQLAEFIQEHPDSRITEKYLLGNTYKFVSLQINGANLYLETNNDRILQLDVTSNAKKLVTYRSYRDSFDLNTPLRLTLE